MLVDIASPIFLDTCIFANSLNDMHMCIKWIHSSYNPKLLHLDSDQRAFADANPFLYSLMPFNSTFLISAHVASDFPKMTLSWRAQKGVPLDGHACLIQFDSSQS